MEKLNTSALVRKVGTRCIGWMVEGNRKDSIETHQRAERLNLSLLAFRNYLDDLLHFVTSHKGTDDEKLLGTYVVVSQEGKEYVTVKRSSSRIPRTPRGYIEWVDWDIPREGGLGPSRYFWQSRYTYGSYSPTKLQKGINTFHKCGVSQALLQSLFGIGEPVDLSCKPLPTSDLRCRLGNYILLYDHLAEEWRIWTNT